MCPGNRHLGMDTLISTDEQIPVCKPNKIFLQSKLLFNSLQYATLQIIQENFYRPFAHKGGNKRLLSVFMSLELRPHIIITK